MIVRENAFPGSTCLSSSVIGKQHERSHFDTQSRLVQILPDANPFIRLKGMSEAAWCDATVADLETAILEIGLEQVGTFLAEPVLCPGGVVIPPEGYHARTLEICRRQDILYISDEVVTGFGRLGHWFASEAVFGIEPDMICCAKGLTSGDQPLGA